MSVHELAIYTGRGYSTTRKMLAEGKGPAAIKLPGSRRLRFRVGEVEAWLASAALRAPSAKEA